ncbi:zona pellucida sperm-binding protein 2-like [Cyrtonyx montezumae]|uniref:zona pellucida sperm-binding protein 2-like n=1 Tax=Cyrtonyx montezumae TaxID=9017 RepID=UPI0032DB5356
METLQTFSVSCNFNSPAFILCYPDGTVIISAEMKTVPGIDMSRTQLRDSSCKPKEYNKGHAFFKFHVTTCGTSVRFEGDHIVYENEISYEKETLPGQSQPTITRDPDYRLTVLCYYRAKETVMLGAFITEPSASRPSGTGTIVPRSNSGVHRRVRQALNVVSRMSKSESFVDFYEPNVAIFKRPMESVFLEVELKDESPDTELYLDNCWVTGSLDFNSTPRCEINGSEYVAEFCSVAASSRVRHPSHFKRLAIRTLTHQLEQMYVHCSVAACSTANTLPGIPCSGQCSPSSERKGHHSAHLQGYVVAGPVWIVEPNLR